MKNWRPFFLNYNPARSWCLWGSRNFIKLLDDWAGSVVNFIDLEAWPGWSQLQVFVSYRQILELFRWDILSGAVDTLPNLDLNFFHCINIIEFVESEPSHFLLNVHKIVGVGAWQNTRLICSGQLISLVGGWCALHDRMSLRDRVQVIVQVGFWNIVHWSILIRCLSWRVILDITLLIWYKKLQVAHKPLVNPLSGWLLGLVSVAFDYDVLGIVWLELKLRASHLVLICLESTTWSELIRISDNVLWKDAHRVTVSVKHNSTASLVTPASFTFEPASEATWIACNDLDGLIVIKTCRQHIMLRVCISMSALENAINKTLSTWLDLDKVF